jgi:hypothetical protein
MTIKTTKTVGVWLTTTPAALLPAVPVGFVRHFDMIHMAHADPVNTAYGTINWVDSSNANAEYPLLHQAEVPKRDAIPSVVGAFSLEAGDYPKGYASADNDICVTFVYWDETAVV